MASAPGTLVPVIARLAAAGEDTVRDVIHAFSARGWPRWTLGGRAAIPAGSVRISDEDVEVIVAAARTRPEKPGQPFTRWSLRKLADYLAGRPERPVRIGRERLRQLLHARGSSCMPAASPSSGPGPGKTRPIRTGTPGWTGSST
nr:hypothetical protein [Trebonia sp.]